MNRTIVTMTIILALFAGLKPQSYSEPRTRTSISDGVFYSHNGDSYLTIHYEVGIDDTTWWFDENRTLDISVTATTDLTETRKNFSVTSILVYLAFDNLDDIVLINRNLNASGRMNLLSNTSGEWIYGLETTTEVFIVPYRDSLLRHGPKHHGNLQYSLLVNWFTELGNEKETGLSNYRSWGITDWTPTEFPIVIDDPLYRVGSIMAWWWFLLVPIPIYILLMFLRKKYEASVAVELLEEVFYWISIGLSGMYVVIVLSLVLGPMVPLFKEFYPVFTVLITIAFGIPTGFMALGLFNIGREEIPFVNQHRRYTEICSILGIAWRSRSEFGNTPYGWAPFKISTRDLNKATSLYLFYAIAIFGVVITIFSPLLPQELFLQQFGAAVFFLSGLSTANAYAISDRIKTDYIKWYKAWFFVWNILYYLTSNPLVFYDYLSLSQKLRKETGDKGPILDILKSELAPEEDQVTIPSEQSRLETIRIGSLSWYTLYYLKPKIQELENPTVRETLNCMLDPFEQDGMPWNHEMGFENLLRRVTYAHFGYIIADYSPQIVQDFASIIREQTVVQAIEDPWIISRIADCYETHATQPFQPEIPATASVKVLVGAWSIFSAIVGFMVSEGLRQFI